MTPAVRRAALADLRDARDAERAGDWRAAYYLRQMVAMSLHIEDETRRAVGVHRGARGRYGWCRAWAGPQDGPATPRLTWVRGVRLPARVGGWADPDTLD